MHQLVTYLNETARAYYTHDAPLISDADWDARLDELLALEAETGVILPNSPTRRVGGGSLPAFQPHTHLTRLWSMEKVKSFGELQAWEARLKRQLQGVSFKPGYVIEYKFDGLTLNLTYNNGALICASTRGDGVTGEDITAQAATIRGIPQTIPYKGQIEVKGEAFMRLSALKAYNATAEEPLKNPRNAAAGALRNLDVSVTASRTLDAFFYSIGYTAAQPTYDDARGMMAFIREQGLPTCDFQRFAADLDAVYNCVCEVESARDGLDFMIDGATVKLDDTRVRDAAGYTDRFPRWEVAYKYPPEELTTTLLDVTWEVGRTGKLTPLAWVEPIKLAGATVSRATLNNYGDILRKGLKIGAAVRIRRSNEVIPEILGCTMADDGNSRVIERPKVCPACGGEIKEIGAHIFCINTNNCRPQIIAKMAHFASREGMDIDALSVKTCGQLYDELDISSPWQLYALTRERLIALPRFGEKRADNLLKELERSRSARLDAFIFALGIPNVGRKTARDLASVFGSLNKSMFEQLSESLKPAVEQLSESLKPAVEQLSEIVPKNLPVSALSIAKIAELMRIPEIGAGIAESIHKYFRNTEEQKNTHELLNLGVSPTWGDGEKLAQSFAGMTVVLTGTMTAMPRAKAQEAILARGGMCAGSVSKKTSLVVAGDNAGSKLDAANKLNISVISEDEFLDMIK